MNNTKRSHFDRQPNHRRKLFLIRAMGVAIVTMMAPALLLSCGPSGGDAGTRSAPRAAPATRTGDLARLPFLQKLASVGAQSPDALLQEFGDAYVWLSTNKITGDESYEVEYPLKFETALLLFSKTRFLSDRLELVGCRFFDQTSVPRPAGEMMTLRELLGSTEAGRNAAAKALSDQAGLRAALNRVRERNEKELDDLSARRDRTFERFTSDYTGRLRGLNRNVFGDAGEAAARKVANLVDAEAERLSTAMDKLRESVAGIKDSNELDEAYGRGIDNLKSDYLATCERITSQGERLLADIYAAERKASLNAALSSAERALRVGDLDGAERAREVAARIGGDPRIDQISEALQRARQDRKAEEARQLEAARRAEDARVAPFRTGAATVTIELADGVTMEFLRVAAGSFEMGGNEDDGIYDEEKPAHRVTLSSVFYLAKTEVTQRQWRAVMGSNPSTFAGDDLPVETVSWDDASAFCERTGLRLPTEAEWEYACRAGTGARWSHGSDGARLREYAWFGDNSDGQSHPVAQKKPNAFGLYDMHGNVREWCKDWLGAYPSASVTDPKGPAASGGGRVNRGGGWDSPGMYARSAFRQANSPKYSTSNLGFRPAKSVPR